MEASKYLQSSQTTTSRIEHHGVVIVVAGTRPEVIKLAPVIHALRHYPTLVTRMVFTGQQAELGMRALAENHLSPNCSISFGDRPRAMRPDLRFMSEQLYDKLHQWHTGGAPPPWVLVQGDTLSALAGAKVANRCGFPMAHLEAGLRSGDLQQPFPEEIVRRLISRYCSLHLAPNNQAVRTLIAEGVDSQRISMVGNPALDQLPRRVNTGEDILVTLHRRETLGPGLQRILECIADLATRFRQQRFIILEHTNPRVLSALDQFRCVNASNLHLSPPLTRKAFLHLLGQARLVMTDSGGVQEESAALGVPTLVLRNVADRPDGLESGNTIVVGTDPGVIFCQAVAALEHTGVRDEAYEGCDGRAGGKAARAMVRAILDAQ